MPLIQVRPFSSKAGGVGRGISLSAGKTSFGFYFKLSMTADAQMRYFGKPLSGTEIALVVNNDPDTRHLMGIRLADGLSLSNGPRGSVQCRITPWLKVTETVKSVMLPVVNPSVPGGGISVHLPVWATPAAVVRSVP
jgi:hypothetical protein